MNGAAEVATNKFVGAKSIYYLFLFVFINIASAFHCAAAKWWDRYTSHKIFRTMPKIKWDFSFGIYK